MRIGIDIDNVISNYEEEVEKEFLNNNAKVVDKTKWIDSGRYNWPIEKTIEFYNNNVQKIASNLKTIENAEKYINKLKEDGDKIYIISGRDNGEYIKPYEMTEKWLKENKINYDELILTNSADSHAKTEECIKNNVECMIDDSPRICKDLQENKIKVWMMERKLRPQKNYDIEMVSSWKEIYINISEYRRKKCQKN